MSEPQLTFERFATGTRHLADRHRVELFFDQPGEDQADAWSRLRDQTEGERLLAWDVIVDGQAPDIFRRRGRPARKTTQSAGRLRIEKTSADDVLLRVPPPVYFEVLARVDVPLKGGNIHCPLHDDRTPSCRVYAEPERGWICFAGCGGGTIYDLASALTALGTRGAAFIELRRWVAERLLAEVRT